MIHFKEFTLENGLHVIVHEDRSSPLVCLNLLYQVGSRNEDPEKTGFAHLFEHLMFGGSKHIASFDEPLQKVGGDNNAFTNTDITNYYITVPSNNVETAFWLESDRMLSLSFDPAVLEVQRSVVMEEFKQRYLNQPYGDVWLELRPLAYQEHPYRWATIGKDLEHIQRATMDDVKDFFHKFYVPNNAILVLAGDINVQSAEKLCKKWFGPIPAGSRTKMTLPQEPKQNEHRFLHLEREVPIDAFYKVYHMSSRSDSRYQAADLLSDLCGRGKASYLYQALVKRQQLFTSISSYVSGSMDPGLFTISGKLASGVTFTQAEESVQKILDDVKAGKITHDDLQKAKNQAEASIVFGEVELLNRAMGLAQAAAIGHVNLVNEELSLLHQVDKKAIIDEANRILTFENSSTLHYHAIK
ncbi:MAG: insulinase family protein [Cyclobacteriaceae bacterium]|nr:insulinase family protein [Cyclobacteriaceae bacterium HetDA_MAG_MS6]